MRTMSLYESKESNGSVSLKDLFEGKFPDMELSNLTVEQIAYAICRGGWPASVRMNSVIFDGVDRWRICISA